MTTERITAEDVDGVIVDAATLEIGMADVGGRKLPTVMFTFANMHDNIVHPPMIFVGKPSQIRRLLKLVREALKNALLEGGE